MARGGNPRGPVPDVSFGNLRRFPSLSGMRPRTTFAYPVRRDESDPVIRQPMIREVSGLAAHVSWPPSTPEQVRRETGPLAQIRAELLSRESTQPRSPRLRTSPRRARSTGRSPAKKPVFSPCNPRQARDAIALPRSVMVNAASPYDAAHGALAEAARLHSERMIGGPFVPVSGSEARKALVNPVTLNSKDAETLECEMHYTQDRARSNRNEFSRTWNVSASTSSVGR